MNVFANFLNIKDKIDKLSKETKLIVITKKQPIEIYQKIIDSGHCHFGENLVQEAVSKWTNVLNINKSLQLHLVGALQTNKVDKAVNIFSCIHSLDRIKLADKLKDEEIKQKKKLKYFIQVNIGSESQKSGVDINELDGLIDFCRTKTNLDIVGLMCIPPLSENPIQYFEKLKILAINHNLKELSMGMSNDFNSAIQSGSTFVRIGSAILGNRIS